MDFLRVVEDDLKTLASESKRKYPEVKDSCDQAMLKLKSMREAYAKALSVEHAPSVNMFKSPEVLRPFLLAANHGDASSKVVNLSLGGIQRLITANNTGPEDIASIVRILVIQSESASSDIQLKVMQTLVLLMTTNQKLDIDDDVLSQSLEICFRLHMMPKAIIHNSAAATLSQVITILYDRVQLSRETNTNSQTNIPKAEGLTSADIGYSGTVDPDNLEGSSRSAYLLFQDLCLQSRGLPPSWLKKVMISKELGLELLDTILAKQPELFRRSRPFAELLQQQICPLLVATLEWEQELGIVLRLFKLASTVLTGFGDLIIQHAESLFAILINTLSKKEEAERKSDIGPGGSSLSVSTMEKSSSASRAKPLTPSSSSRGAEAAVSEWRVVLTVDTVFRLCSKFDLLQTLFSSYDSEPAKPDLVTALVISIVDYVQKTAQKGLGLAQSGTPPARPLDTLLSADPEHTVPDVHGAFRQAVQCLLSLAEGMEAASKFVVAVSSSSCGPLMTMVEVIFQPIMGGICAVLTYCESSQYLVDLILRASLSIGLACGHLGLEGLRDTLLRYLCGFALSIRGPSGFKTSPSSLWKSTQCFRIVLDIIKGLDYNVGNAWGCVLETLDEFEALSLSKTLIAQSQSQGGMDLDRELASVAASARLLFEMSRNWSDVALVQGALALAGYSAFSLGVVGELYIEKYSPKSKVIKNIQAPQLVKGQTEIQAIQWSASSLPQTLANPINEAAAVAAAAAAAAARDVRKKANTAKPMLGASGASASWKTPTYLTIEPSMMFGQPRALPRSPPFALRKLVEISRLNIFRIGLVWPTVADHFGLIMDHKESTIRQYVTDSFAQLLIAAMTYVPSTSSGSSSGPVSTKDSSSYAVPASFQDQLLYPMEKFISSSCSDVQENTLLGLNTFLQSCGHLLNIGWPIVFRVLKQVALHASPSRSAEADLSNNTAPDGINSENVEHAGSTGTSSAGGSKRLGSAGSRVKAGFLSVQLIVDDFLPTIPSKDVNLCLECVGSYGGQEEDINVCLTAINMLWASADFLNSKAKEGTGGPTANVEDVWLKLFDELQRLSLDGRPEVRNCALNTLISTACALGGQFQAAQWQRFFLNVFFPLLERIEVTASAAIQEEKEGGKASGSKSGGGKMLVHHSRDSAEKQWSETRVLGIQGVVRTLRAFTKALQKQEWFETAWNSAISICKRAIAGAGTRKEVAISGISGLQTLAQLVSVEGVPQTQTSRAAVGMKVVDGALTVANSESTTDTGGNRDVKPQELNECGSLPLWQKTWRAFESVAPELESHDDVEVRAALVRSLSALYCTSKLNEFSNTETMNTLLDLLFRLVTSSNGQHKTGGSARFTPSVTAIQKEALQFYRDLSPSICGPELWVKAFKHLLAVKAQPGVSAQFSRDVNRALLLSFSEQTPEPCRVQVLGPLASSLVPFESDNNGENSSSIEVLVHMMRVGLPPLTAEAASLNSKELADVLLSIVKAIDCFILGSCYLAELKPSGLVSLPPEWDVWVIEQLIDNLGLVNEKVEVPPDVQHRVVEFLAEASGVPRGAETSARIDPTQRKQCSDLCLRRLFQISYNSRFKESFAQAASNQLLVCVSTSISAFLNEESHQEIARAGGEADLDPSGLELPKHRLVRVLSHLLDVLQRAESAEVGTYIVLQLFPLLCEVITSMDSEARDLLKHLLSASGVQELAKQQLKMGKGANKRQI